MSAFGIDVSKDSLDWAEGSEASAGQSSNDRAGIEALVRRVKRLGPKRIVFESTGGYERSLVAALADDHLGRRATARPPMRSIERPLQGATRRKMARAIAA
jgi:transposase